MGQTTVRRATYDDILALPPHVTGQIIDGILYVSPRPAGKHAVATSALGADLAGAYMRGRGGPGGWWIIDEPELHFGEQIVVPDIAGWRRERLPEYPPDPYVTLAPDWVCEVLSPSTAALDRARKTQVYARAGVRHLWLLDPEARTLEVLAVQDGRWLLLAVHSGDDVVRGEPFLETGVALASLWPGQPGA